MNKRISLVIHGYSEPEINEGAIIAECLADCDSHSEAVVSVIERTEHILSTDSTYSHKQNALTNLKFNAGQAVGIRNNYGSLSIRFTWKEHE